MTVTVRIEQTGNEFEASVVGMPSLTIRAGSRCEVLESVRSRLTEEAERGDLVTLELPLSNNIMSQAGAYADDPTLAEICRDAYAARDLERDSLPASE